jgi:hypothetical protein
VIEANVPSGPPLCDFYFLGHFIASALRPAYFTASRNTFVNFRWSLFKQ